MGENENHYDDSSFVGDILAELVEKAVQAEFVHPETRANEAANDLPAVPSVLAPFASGNPRHAEMRAARLGVQRFPGNYVGPPALTSRENNDDDHDDIFDLDFIPFDDDAAPPVGAHRNRQRARRPKASITQGYGSMFLNPQNSVLPSVELSDDSGTLGLQSFSAPDATRKRTRYSIRLMNKARGARARSPSVYSNDGRNRESPKNSRAIANNTPAPLKVQGGRISKRERARARAVSVQSALAEKLVHLRLPHSSSGRRLNTVVRDLKVVIQNKASAIQFASEVAEDSPTTLGASLGPRIVFFPDGSGKGPRGICGSGVSYKRCLTATTDWINASVGILGNATSGDAELIAIGIALNIARCEIQAIHQLASGLQATYPTIFVVTDSQSSLVWIEQYIQGTVTNKRISRGVYQQSFTQLLDPLTRLESLGVKVEFHWTKGHQPVVGGNCRADRLARQAADWMLAQTDNNALCKVRNEPYKVRFTHATSPSVRRLFKDQNEDIALLLEDSHNNQLIQSPASHLTPRLSRAQSVRQAPVLNQGLPPHVAAHSQNEDGAHHAEESPAMHQDLVLRQHPGGNGRLILDLTEDVHHSEEPGKKENRPKGNLEKIISPLKRFVQNVTGYKRKHGETSPSDANSNKLVDGKITDYFPGYKGKPPQSKRQAPHRDIEVIDLTGEDEDRGNANPGYVVRNEAGVEVIDLTGGT